MSGEAWERRLLPGFVLRVLDHIADTILGAYSAGSPPEDIYVECPVCEKQRVRYGHEAKIARSGMCTICAQTEGVGWTRRADG